MPCFTLESTFKEATPYIHWLALFRCHLIFRKSRSDCESRMKYDFEDEIKQQLNTLLMCAYSKQCLFFSNKLPNNSASVINIWTESLWSNFAVPFILFRRNSNDSIEHFLECLIPLVLTKTISTASRQKLYSFWIFLHISNLLATRKKSSKRKNKISDRTCVVF